MNIVSEIWNTPTDYLLARSPDSPVHFFAPSILQAQAKRFLAGFNGLVTYAVKANPDPAVITNLVAAGLQGFDVASPNEIKLLRELAPHAALHYNNPVRSRTEIRFALKMGVKSFSVDGFNELAKLQELLPPSGIEVSVRIKLPVSGAAYDFGAKFGATPEKAIELLRRVKAAGFLPSMTFHPGTQCEDKMAWKEYITASAAVSRAAGVPLHRLNVGGGFPCKMASGAPDLEGFFALIDETVAAQFGDARPALVCEPGRAMVAESFSHATRVKSVNDNGDVFLNDGIYGGLSEFPVLDIARGYAVVSENSTPATSPVQASIYGPTCDSLDVLPARLKLPSNIADDDYVVFQSMGAYVKGVTTDFNGYGQLETVTVLDL